MGAFFLVIHSLVSTLVYGYVPTQPYFLSNKIAYSKLPIPFNDSLRISLYFLHFIYSLGATFDIKTTVSTCVRFVVAKVVNLPRLKLLKNPMGTLLFFS
ncbi:hypothetical protein HMPREF0380_01429, partial [Eubacterium infirmum F0142]